jgi:putative sterol carrier protein
VGPYDFLSPEWIAAAKAIRDEYAGRVSTPEHPVRMNLVVTDAPFSDEPVRGFIDTGDGEVIVEEGHLDAADLTLTVDWTTARTIFVDGDPQAAMQAFMGGRIRVHGDMSKLMLLQAQQQQRPDPGLAEEIAVRVKEITRL